MAERTELTFDSDGVACAAYLYRPSVAVGATPCVVMAHGLASTRDDGLPAYAQRFAEAGLAVLLFDYRHFGASGGQPRQLVDVGRQHEDYHAAIRYARTLDGIDPDRIVLWGSSFSGGHVIAVAARDFRVAAVITQVPYADGLAVAWQASPRTLFRLAAVGLQDAVRVLLGRPPKLVPAVGQPGQIAAMTAPEAESGMRALVGEDSQWRNEVTARTLLALPLYRPGLRAENLGMPVLVCVADDDRITPPAAAIRMAQRAPRGELRRYPGGHFEIYQGEMFERVVADQLEFLRQHGLTAP
ncbi:MAG TPA: alpha/beta fold hydrolase [Pseudonocardiaceae bacterium]|nr:alpha/beta fold hydrolase [Pseudonocardiaceae bacterium]